MHGAESVSTMASNGVVKTHLPFNLQPYHSKAKYLIVLRNSKDVCVSYYHHCRKSKSHFDGDFHAFFDIWIKGEVPFGDYFDHVLSWWRHKHDDNVTIIVYEDMKKNPRESVLNIAKFLGDDYVQKLIKNEKMIDVILERSSVSFMKKEMKFDFLVRKGVTGDWKNYFTEEESQMVNDMYDRKFKGTGIEQLWSDVMSL